MELSKSKFQYEGFLYKIKNPILTKFRLSNNCLHIETGRYEYKINIYEKTNPPKIRENL
jgi:hypothetical protein